MNTKSLIESAGKLKKPGEKASREFSEKKPEILAMMNKVMLQRPDLTELVGENRQEMMKDNHNNQLRFMESVFNNFIPQVLVETVLWVYRAYRSHGFKLTYWPALLNTAIHSMKEVLSKEAYDEIYPFYNWMLINQATFVKITDKQLNIDPS